MSIQYRSDTGTLLTPGSTPSNISFVSTQPSNGDAVFAGGGWWFSVNAITPSVTDNQTGNTYTVDICRSSDGATSVPTSAHDSCTSISSCLSVNSSGTFTLTFTSTGYTSSWDVLGGVAFSGVKSSGALDVSSSNYASGIQSSLGTGTTGTTVNADSVAISSLSVSSGTHDTNSITYDAGYSQIALNALNSSGHQGGLIYKILTAQGTQSVTWSFGSATISGDYIQAAIAVYQGAAPPPPPPRELVTPMVSTGIRR